MPIADWLPYPPPLYINIGFGLRFEIFLDHPFGPSTLTLRFIPRDRPLLVESLDYNDRLLWRFAVQFSSKNRTLSSWTLAHMTVQFCSRPSTFARPSTLRTVHFHSFGPSTLDQTWQWHFPTSAKLSNFRLSNLKLSNFSFLPTALSNFSFLPTALSNYTYPQNPPDRG